MEIIRNDSNSVNMDLNIMFLNNEEYKVIKYKNWNFARKFSPL